ncbi:cytochrome P450 98A8-like [Herrania umbratica]|uniref:Cytochrome P450 98A8-like n=1 Tax=Herrania umbratica TaxID=108875 RepID=A0A6J1AWX3_9ROSI|nr:cytochrome P450 98A8-like [Herrania umbratica]
MALISTSLHFDYSYSKTWSWLSKNTNGIDDFSRLFFTLVGIFAVFWVRFVRKTKELMLANDHVVDSVVHERLKSMRKQEEMAGRSKVQESLHDEPSYGLVIEVIKQPEIMREVQQELEEIVGMNDVAEESHTKTDISKFCNEGGLAIASSLSSSGSSKCRHILSYFSRLLFTLVVVFAVFWYTWMYIKSKNKGKPPSPPGPRGLPLVGNRPFLQPDLHSYFAELARTYGPVVKLQLGSKIGILVTSPSAAREVLKDQDIVFANRDVPVAGMLVTGGRDIVGNHYGPEWRMLRKVCVLKMLSNATLDKVYSLRRTEVRETVSYMHSMAGSPVNVGEQMFLTIFINKPEVMRKAQQELEEVVGKDKIVEETHIYKLPYLLAIMKESLRLHPALPLLVPHSPSEDCTVGTYAIPKGCRVFVNAWAIHRDPSVWENPLEFNPDRFLNSKWDFSGRDFNYFPFGSGSRICAGTAMAERMVLYSIATLLHSFDWKVAEGMKLDLTEKFGIVLKLKNPLVAVPTPRLSIPALYE